jgi:hypothetical protein
VLAAASTRAGRRRKNGTSAEWRHRVACSSSPLPRLAFVDRGGRVDEPFLPAWPRRGSALSRAAMGANLRRPPHATDRRRAAARAEERLSAGGPASRPRRGASACPAAVARLSRSARPRARTRGASGSRAAYHGESQVAGRPGDDRGQATMPAEGRPSGRAGRGGGGGSAGCGHRGHRAGACAGHPPPQRSAADQRCRSQALLPPTGRRGCCDDGDLPWRS